MTSPDFAQTLRMHLDGPKTRGGAHLRAATLNLGLQVAMNYSSLAALACASIYTGTAAYASANSYLDALSEYTRAFGLAATSIQMANVGGAGSGALASDRMAALPGMVRITLDHYAANLSSALLPSRIGPQAVLPAPCTKEGLLREFEGPAKVMVADQRAAIGELDEPVHALRRNLSVTARVHAAHAAISALDAAAQRSFTAQQPSVSDVVIIGAGLTGLIFASHLKEAGADLSVLEKANTVGGVWRWYGNPHSRVNSTEPAYRMARLKRETENTDHSYFFEVIDDMRRAIEQHHLHEHLHLGTEVRSIVKDKVHRWRRRASDLHQSSRSLSPLAGYFCSAQTGVLARRVRSNTRESGITRDCPSVVCLATMSACNGREQRLRCSVMGLTPSSRSVQLSSTMQSIVRSLYAATD